MGINKLNIEDIIIDDIRELIACRVPEGPSIDYKQTTYGHSDGDKKELAKDISAFANANGGHIIIGIRESSDEAGIPSEITPLNINQEEEINRIYQIARNCIEPTLSGLRVIPIETDNSGCVLIIRIPKSWNTPHRVNLQNENRFWVRHGSMKDQASMEEIREMFMLSTNALENARKFRDERINSIRQDTISEELYCNGRCIIHIGPLSAFTSNQQINLENAQQNNPAFKPIGGTRYFSEYNFDGFINIRRRTNTEERSSGYTQIFRNGIIEATKANILSSHNVIDGENLEGQIFEKLTYYIDGLYQLGVDTPLVFTITFQGVNGTQYYVRLSSQTSLKEFKADTYKFPECFIEEYSDDTSYYHRAVKPAFDAIWNTIGLPEDKFFDENGLWRPGPQ